MKLSTKVAVAVGLLVFISSILPALGMFMGGCFFEGICEAHQDAAIPFALVISCVAGVSAGLVFGYLVPAVVERIRKGGRDQKALD